MRDLQGRAARRRRGRWAAAILLSPVIIALLVAVYASFDPVNGTLPFCVKPKASNDYAAVACSDPSAEYRVIARRVGRHKITNPDCQAVDPASEKSWIVFRWYRGYYLLCLARK